MIKICLWASAQEHNIGVGDYGTEEDNMFKVCDILEGLLNKYEKFEIHRNEKDWELYDNVRNEWNVRPDIVLEVHSNAGGGKGAEVYCNTKNEIGMDLAQLVYNEVSLVTPVKDRGIKDGMHLYDIRKTYAPAVLVELFFHDDLSDVYHFENNTTLYAIALEKALCMFYAIEFREWQKEPQPTIKDELIDLQSKLNNIIERM